MAANASSNNPGTNTLEEPVPQAAAAAHAAPPPDATEAEISEAVSAWISSHRITITDGVIQCLDQDQTVPQYAQDRMDHNLALINSLKQEGSHKARRIHQQLPAKENCSQSTQREKLTTLQRLPQQTTHRQWKTWTPTHPILRRMPQLKLALKATQ